MPNKMPNKTSEQNAPKVEVAETIVKHLAAASETTSQELAAALGFCDRTIKKHLHRLKAAGQIRRIGSTKKGHWKVVAPRPEPTPSPAAPADFSKLPVAESEALKLQVMRALHAAFQAYVAA